MQEISKYDISTYYERSLNLSDKERHDLIRNISIVEPGFIFPISFSKKRCFQYEWLQEFPWLKYSKVNNGGYCLPCVLFAKRAPGKFQNVTNLVKRPVIASPDSKTTFKRHQSSNGLHSFCQNAFGKFLESYSGKSKSIDVIVNDIVKQQVSENRAVINSLVDTVILCGHLGLPLRGHRDDSFYHPEAGQYATNSGVGNFIEIVNFAIRRGDSTLKNHYKNHKKNASYLSKTTQNELIKFCGEVISEEIVSEVKSAKFFSVLADEAMDRSGKEQLSFVLRYVDDSNNIQENFLGFVHLGEGLSGEALSKAVLAKIDSLGLNIENCRGQCYDGAGAVAGVRNGCSAHILRINHKALYTHCFSHKLNLSVSKSSKIVSVSNMMEKVKAISDFFRNSEQRQLVFEKYVDQFNPESSKNKLKDVCRTRWVERIDGLEMFVSLYSSIWNSLNDMRLDISLSRNYQTRQDAFRLFKDVDEFDFIINLIVVYRIFDITLDATILLQSKKNDIADGLEIISSLLNVVSEYRNNVDIKHSEWYDEALSLAKKYDIAEKKIRTTKRQIHRDNQPASTPCEFYKRSLTIPLLDQLLNDLRARFSDNSLISYYGLYLLPSKIVSMEKDRRSGKPVKSIADLVTPFYQFYKSDLPFPDHFFQELDTWRDIVLNHDTPPSNVATTLKTFKFSGIENIKTFLKILATIPITSCECERSFSGMRRLVNFCRTTMLEERLNGLALMNFHLDMIPDAKKVMEKYGGAKNRRLSLCL